MAILVNVRLLVMIIPLLLDLSGVGISPGPFHWGSEVSVIPFGKETRHVKMTVAPLIIGEGREDDREIVAGADHEKRENKAQALISMPTYECIWSIDSSTS